MKPRSNNIQRQAIRLLELLAEHQSIARLEGDRVIIHAPRNGSAIRTGTIPKTGADHLVGEGLAIFVKSKADSGERLRLTELGEKKIRRLRHLARIEPGAEQCLAAAMDGEIDAFRAQHDDIVKKPVQQDGETSRAYFNESESPLLWLRRRKGSTGEALIGAAAFAAGEKLRQDYTLAHMAARMGADWSNPLAGAKYAGSGGMHATDRMIAARQRFNLALEAVGPEFSGLLFDLCCYLKGLERIEREHGWPARSAKVVARLALDCLARYYGFSDEARGRGPTGIIRKWGDEDYRPKI